MKPDRHGFFDEVASNWWLCARTEMSWCVVHLEDYEKRECATSAKQSVEPASTFLLLVEFLRIFYKR